MKVILVGLWVTLVALGTAYGVAVYMPSSSAQGKAAPAVVLQSQKTRVINVPILADAQVRGFMAVQFVFTTDSTLTKTLQVPPEVYLLDEAFRTIYADSTLYLNHGEKLRSEGFNDSLGREHQRASRCTHDQGHPDRKFRLHRPGWRQDVAALPKNSADHGAKLTTAETGANALLQPNITCVNARRHQHSTCLKKKDQPEGWSKSREETPS